MHSHHTHSGQFCQHAENTLEEMVERAIALGYTIFCLTEHMPRLSEKDLYPEELNSKTTTKHLAHTFQLFYQEAQLLKRKYADKIRILVGFETEMVSHNYLEYIKDLQLRYPTDLIVGSVHHVKGIPIDFDQTLWDKACEASGGVAELYENYYDLQYEMILALEPSVIGHFDLIRLFSREILDVKNHPRIWSKIQRNVLSAIERKCLFEINCAGLRKGLDAPYPEPSIGALIRQEGGRFCLSDDAHSVEQIGLNYDRALPCIKHMCYRLYSVDGTSMSVEDLEKWIPSSMT